MTSPVEQLTEILPAVADLVDELAAEQLLLPTPCDDFTVHDVIDHMIVLGSGFAHLFRGEDVPEILPPAVYGRVPAAEFRTAMDTLVDAVSNGGKLNDLLETPLGGMHGATFAAVVAFDGLMHGWDLAVASGRHLPVSDEVIEAVDGFARVAIADEHRDAGMFDAPSAAPGDATALEALAAFSGRRVEDRWRTHTQGLSLEKDAVPIILEVDGATARQQLDFGDSTGYGWLAGEYFTLAAGTDLAPLLSGLSNDACHAPHWGYMLEGEVVVTFLDGRTDTTIAGQLFYWPPGHTVRVTADAELVLFSPQEEHVAVVDHMREKLGAA